MARLLFLTACVGSSGRRLRDRLLASLGRPWSVPVVVRVAARSHGPLAGGGKFAGPPSALHQTASRSQTTCTLLGKKSCARLNRLGAV